jgi:hypothetical protein
VTVVLRRLLLAGRWAVQSALLKTYLTEFEAYSPLFGYEQEEVAIKIETQVHGFVQN